jgi:membrane-bound lytic murein transglycosylase B
VILQGLLAAVCAAAPVPYADRPEVQEWIKGLAARQHFDAAALTELMKNAVRLDSVLEKIAKPAEAKGWKDYRAIFIKPERIAAGVEFWQRNEAALAQAEEKYGVDRAVILGILGVETRYGFRTGEDRVLDALATLAFDYPRRASFFKKELEEFLLLCREQGFDPLAIKGSYAGAMGLGQFMPSSYRALAVDEDGDGKKNLWSEVDAIGSVANYFAKSAWKKGAAVVVQADAEGAGSDAFLGKGIKTTLLLAELRKAGLTPREQVEAATKVSLHKMEGEAGAEYWLGLHNFWVISRYNNSALYALAVHQLSQEVQKAKNTPPF